MKQLQHGYEICPVYSDTVLLTDDGTCSLCGSNPDETLLELIEQRERIAFLLGHESAVHHIKLYGKHNVLTGGQL